MISEQTATTFRSPNISRSFSKLDLLENMDGRKAEMEQGLARLEEGLKKAARALSAGREKKASEFDAAVNAFLKSLNMPAAGFRTRLTPFPLSPPRAQRRWNSRPP